MTENKRKEKRTTALKKLRRRGKKKMNITLNEKEKNCVKDLADQEKLCIQKYEKYASMAKDKVLCDLFTMIKSDEEKHLSSLNSLMSGTVSTDVNVNDNAGAT